MTVSASGQISAEGMSVQDGAISGTGMVGADGAMQTVAGNASDGATFTGMIDTTTSPWTLSGSWSNTQYGMTGSFSGVKQQQ